MLALVCLAALVLAVVALSRTAAGGSLTERIAALEREVRQLRALLQAREAAPERAEKPEPAPLREPAAPQAGAPPAAPPFPPRPASILYGLVPTPVAFVLMVAVTASGCILSWRHTSQVIASLGLIGGFLTPLLLSTGADRPIGLFGYVLLLDTGLLYLARQRRWPVLALLSLAGTLFYQALWIGTRMGPDRLFLGLAILGAFAFLFTAPPRLAGGEEADLEWLVAQAGGVLVPFAFVLYFASSTRFSLHFHPYRILLVPLSAAAGWIARAQLTYRIGLGAAAATGAIVGA